MVVYFPLLIALIGLITYALAKPDNAKVLWLGQTMFWCGLLAFLIRVTPEAFRVIR